MRQFVRHRSSPCLPYYIIHSPVQYALHLSNQFTVPQFLRRKIEIVRDFLFIFLAKGGGGLFNDAVKINK